MTLTELLAWLLALSLLVNAYLFCLYLGESLRRRLAENRINQPEIQSEQDEG